MNSFARHTPFILNKKYRILLIYLLPLFNRFILGNIKRQIGVKIFRRYSVKNTRDVAEVTDINRMEMDMV